MARPPHRTAAILAIGDELAIGQKLDTNSQWIATRLLELGVVTCEHATVDDERPRIAFALERLAGLHDLVICTGGLGPTPDDLTRHALADAMHESLVEDPDAREAIERWFARRGRALRETNLVQALRPSSARCLDNEFGTAPGLAGRIGNADVFVLPGPPREMRPMFERFVEPAIRREPGRLVRTHVMQSVGLGESEVSARLGEMLARTSSPTVGLTASSGVVTVRIRYEGEEHGAQTEIDRVRERVRAQLGAHVFAEGEASLAEACLERLCERGERLLVVESCTGGMLGSALVDVPGSSDAFLGGCITYSNDMKADRVGVSRDDLDAPDIGAVSERVASQMARGAIERLGTGELHALAISGVAGPGGGSERKPVGTVCIAHAHRAASSAEPTVRAITLRITGDRTAVRRRSVQSALAMLHFALIDHPIPTLLWQRGSGGE
ncbi:MAG: CinA family nicotinamide mononucleotide deamidase-related protein [Planctomycetota bacterium]